jgi:ABC-type Fe3+/spermidine/putrescine transport system ATPase subunit
MVFQSYALFPHMTVFENAAYGLRVRQIPTSTIRPKVERLLGLLGLGGLANRHPADLSGGQQQRVSIARALAYDPNMFLLDEPLANLDAKLRIQMREEIRRIQKELGVMALYVTHDQEEAMSVSDRIGVFNLGKLMQVGAPPTVYQHPTSLFVADFIGKINLFPASKLNGDSGGCRVRLQGGLEVVLQRLENLTSQEKDEFGIPGDAVVAVRPEHLILSKQDDSGIKGRVRRILFLGSLVRYFVTCDEALKEVVVETPSYEPTISEGQEAFISFLPKDAICYKHEGKA